MTGAESICTGVSMFLILFLRVFYVSLLFLSRNYGEATVGCCEPEKSNVVMQIVISLNYDLRHALGCCNLVIGVGCNS